VYLCNLHKVWRKATVLYWAQFSSSTIQTKMKMNEKIHKITAWKRRFVFYGDSSNSILAQCVNDRIYIFDHLSSSSWRLAESMNWTNPTKFVAVTLQPKTFTKAKGSSWPSSFKFSETKSFETLAQFHATGHEATVDKIPNTLVFIW